MPRRRLRATRVPAGGALPGFCSTSNSIHSPRYGWIVPVTSWCLAGFRSRNRSPGWKITPGDRTSCETTTRSVPLITNVPLSVIMGKSPMKTVCDLISPVVLLVNSAVTNSGAAYVMSLSLHSSTEYLVGSKRWSRKLSDIDPEKSSMGEISSKISSRPDRVETSSRPASTASLTRDCQSSLPTSQSNEETCRSSRLGTSSGSRILAKEMRGFLLDVRGLLRAAKRGPSEGTSEDRCLPKLKSQAAHTHSTGRHGHTAQAVI